MMRLPAQRSTSPARRRSVRRNRLALSLLLSCAAAAAAAAATASADVIHLKDGTRLEGQIKRSGGGWTVSGADGSVRRVQGTEVASIELLGDGAATGPAADERLSSLRRSVDSLSDPAVALERYRRFIEQHADTPAAAEARKDMPVWEERLAQGLVKVGDQWLTPAERSTIQHRALALVGEARRLVKDGRFRDAEAMVKQILMIDRGNVSAHYLRGVMAHAQDQTPAARRAFEAVNDRLPGHAPTLNNLAIVLWRQNQHAAALNRYDEAMRAAPLDQEILDNVAEALHALPENVKKGPVAERVTKRFSEQDEQLQQRLAQYGLYRLGAQWLNAEQMAAYREAERKVMGQLDELAGAFDAVEHELAPIRAAVAQRQQRLRELPGGNRGPFAGDLADSRDVAERRAIEAELGALEQDAGVRLARQEEIKAAARELLKQLPAVRYTGVQSLIGPEGTPLVPPDAPTTGSAPETNPSAGTAPARPSPPESAATATATTQPAAP